MTTLQLVEGTTEPIDAILKADNVAINLTGMTVVLILHDRTGAVVPVADGDVTITNAATGAVRYSPASSTTLLNSLSPLTAHWRVRVTATGKDTYIPRSAGDKWTIHRQ